MTFGFAEHTMENGTVVLTRRGYDKLKSEYQVLIEEKRPQVLSWIDEARSHGDLSENESYQEARREQAVVEDRIEELEEILKHAEVVEEGNPDRVQVGSTVILEREDTVQEYQVVGEHEADIAAGKISHSSPIGQALIGKGVGDLVEVEVPAGKARFRVVQISSGVGGEASSDESK